MLDTQRLSHFLSTDFTSVSQCTAKRCSVAPPLHGNEDKRVWRKTQCNQRPTRGRPNSVPPPSMTTYAMALQMVGEMEGIGSSFVTLLEESSDRYVWIDICDIMNRVAP